jgi:hypothetical protein
MSAQAQHTALPFEVETYADAYEVMDETLTITIARIGGARAAADAAFIVRACNSHYELLDALRAVKALALPGATHIHAVVDAAIAKATQA